MQIYCFSFTHATPVPCNVPCNASATEQQQVVKCVQMIVRACWYGFQKVSRSCRLYRDIFSQWLLRTKRQPVFQVCNPADCGMFSRDGLPLLRPLTLKYIQYLGSILSFLANDCCTSPPNLAVEADSERQRCHQHHCRCGSHFDFARNRRVCWARDSRKWPSDAIRR